MLQFLRFVEKSFLASYEIFEYFANGNKASYQKISIMQHNLYFYFHEERCSHLNTKEEQIE